MEDSFYTDLGWGGGGEVTFQDASPCVTFIRHFVCVAAKCAQFFRPMDWPAELPALWDSPEQEY